MWISSYFYLIPAIPLLHYNNINLIEKYYSYSMTLFERTNRKNPPLWLMRQAGRYLPEYREIRQNFDQFLDFCFTPTLAAEVTLQPIRRFDFDAAIIFSDILVIPHALGQRVWFEKGEGPKLEPFDKRILDSTDYLSTLEPVFEALRLTRKELDPSKSLIGFCGAPWTVATYMIEGGGSKDHHKTREYAYQDLERFQHLLMTLARVSANYLMEQIKAGADTLQIFDSWAGSVPDGHFESWVIEPTRLMVALIKSEFPHIPIIGFPKGVGEKAIAYAAQTNVDGLGLDPTSPLTRIVQEVSPHVVLQGNLDPALLVVGGDIMAREVNRIHSLFQNRPYIFNLGHGIVPHTPIENVEALVRQVRGLTREKDSHHLDESRGAFGV